jgi:hypothetical protein
VANQWDRSWFYRNDARRPGAALVLDLRLPAGAGTRPAVGATATVHLPDGSRRSAELTPHPAYVFIHYSHPSLLQRVHNLKQ